MNYSLAHTLAADMVQRLGRAPDFFKTLKEFDSQRKFKEEYSFAVHAAMAQRIPYEEDAWRKKAQKFLGDQGIS